TTSRRLAAGGLSGNQVSGTLRVWPDRAPTVVRISKGTPPCFIRPPDSRKTPTNILSPPRISQPGTGGMPAPRVPLGVISTLIALSVHEETRASQCLRLEKERAPKRGPFAFGSRGLLAQTARDVAEHVLDLVAKNNQNYDDH